MTAQLDLAITIAEQRDPKGAVTGAAAYRSQLAWTEHSVWYDNAKGDRIELDFAAQQERSIDQRNRTVTTRPLHAIVHMRSAEAKNRGLHIHEVLKAGGLIDNDFAPILAEHQLAVRLPGRQPTVGKRRLLARRPDIEIVECETEIDMKVGQRCLLSVSRSRHAAPEAGSAFAQFLRYAFGGHPRLLQRIVEEPGVPASVTLRGLAPMHTGGEVTVRVIGPSEPAPALSTAGFEARLAVDGSDPIDAVLGSDVAVTEPPSLATRHAEAVAMLQGEAPLAGLLSVLELSLERGHAIPPEVPMLVNSSRDEAVRRFLAQLSPATSQADARDKLRALELLRGRADRMAYLIGAFEAPLHRTLQQWSEAKAALIAVLEANPRVTGAWKDLGELYCAEYNFTRTWLSWERARTLAPDHPLLNDVTDCQRNLETNHPEFYRVR